MVHLKLRKPKTDRKVDWSTDTVDNEHMNKKKSKCKYKKEDKSYSYHVPCCKCIITFTLLGCCIYKKPRKFGESSSSDSSDDECEHCQGHVEKKKKHKTVKPNSNITGSMVVDSSESSSSPGSPEQPDSSKPSDPHKE